MNGVGYAAAVLLASAFVVAGVTKLQRRSTTIVTFVRLGLGRRSRGLAFLIPLLEIGVAVGLVLAPVVFGAVAIVLLVVFSWILGRAIRAGKHVSCGCFGSLSNRPIGPADLVRNAGLVLAAGAAAMSVPTLPELIDIIVVTTGISLFAVAIAIVQSRAAPQPQWVGR